MGFIHEGRCAYSPFIETITRGRTENAIIYGAAGGIGRGVALTFAREGARVYLAGRSLEKLERVAAEIH